MFVVFEKLFLTSRQFNYARLPQITYRCNPQDLGRKKVTPDDIHRENIAKIFQGKAYENMQGRIQDFSNLQSKIKNHETR